MKTPLLIFLFFHFGILTLKGDQWTQNSNFPGGKRSQTFSFSIGGKGYVGGGVDDNNKLLNDFWEFDPSTNIWSQKADFKGTPRQNAKGFSILDKGYVVFGVDALGMNFHISNELWEYDPKLDTWNKKSSFPGLGRQGVTSFTIDERAFIGFGEDLGPQYDDLWEYDQSKDTWTKKTSLPSNARSGAIGFAIGSKGYIGLGSNQQKCFNDFWEYDQTKDSWARKSDFLGSPRTQASSFSIGDKGYVGTGNLLFSWINDFWQYNPSNDSWYMKKDFGGAARDHTFFFSLGNKGYIGCGSYFDFGYKNLNDFWEYNPDGAVRISNKIDAEVDFTISPLPFINNLNVNFYNKLGYADIEIIIYSLTGVIEHRILSSDNKIIIDTCCLSAGTYLIAINYNGVRSYRKILKL